MSKFLEFFSSSAEKETSALTNHPAPVFKTKTHDGKDFDLSVRKGQWTILYFYPKAETPGCTKQACAFRDSIKPIRDMGGEVFGISADTVDAQAKFHSTHRLNFTLLADANAEIITLYGAKLPLVKISKRWTFVIDPDLRIRAIEKGVDPVADPGRVVEIIKSLKN